VHVIIQEQEEEDYKYNFLNGKANFDFYCRRKSTYNWLFVWRTLSYRKILEPEDYISWPPSLCSDFICKSYEFSSANLCLTAQASFHSPTSASPSTTFCLTLIYGMCPLSVINIAIFPAKMNSLHSKQPSTTSS